MKSSIKLGRIFGIEIGAHLSWIIIATLVLLSLASYFAPTYAWSPLMQWGAALLAALLFFGSVITHELGHSLVAQHYGIQVRSITLFLFGGVSQLEGETKRPSEEFWIAIVGPLTSIAVAILFSAISVICGLGALIGAVAAWLTGINLALAIFNLLPGFPLDRGRVLRGLVWWITGNAKKANRVATETGQILAIRLNLVFLHALSAIRLQLHKSEMMSLSYRYSHYAYASSKLVLGRSLHCG
ncbi:MAG: site-2 protease family protein [Acidobacteriota bacterium]